MKTNKVVKMFQNIDILKEKGLGKHCVNINAKRMHEERRERTKRKKENTRLSTIGVTFFSISSAPLTSFLHSSIAPLNCPADPTMCLPTDPPSMHIDKHLLIPISAHNGRLHFPTNYPWDGTQQLEDDTPSSR